MNITYIFVLTLFMCFITFDLTRAGTTDFLENVPIDGPKTDLDKITGRWYPVAARMPHDSPTKRFFIDLKKISDSELEVKTSTISQCKCEEDTTIWRYDSHVDDFIPKVQSKFAIGWKVHDVNYDTYAVIIYTFPITNEIEDMVVVLSRKESLPQGIIRNLANSSATVTSYSFKEYL